MTALERIERGAFGPDFRAEWNGSAWVISRKVGLGRSASTIAPTLAEAIHAFEVSEHWSRIGGAR